MTPTERLLVLDAALTMCEGVFDTGTDAIIRQLQKKMESYVARLERESYPTFGEYLDAQRNAICKLHASEHLFGGE